MSKASRFSETEFMAHFPSTISEEIEAYCTDRVLADSRYLFTTREGRKQYAFCTHCKLDHQSDGLKHGKIAECPHCRSACTVKAHGRGRKTLFDDAYLLWYEKSVIDPKVLIARGFYMSRDYTGNYRATETVIKPIALYVFEWGKGGKMLSRDYWSRSFSWRTASSPYSELTRSMANKNCYRSVENIRDAVAGTSFQYCTWEHYEVYDYVKTFDLAARYSCMEFLTKAGLGSLVKGKLIGQQTYGAVNWNGKTPEKVLRLTKLEIKQMRKAGGIGPRTLRSFQLSKKEGTNFSWEEARALSDLIESYNLERLQELTKFAPVLTIKKYFAKQYRRAPGRYPSGSTILLDWQDYLKECRDLGRDISRPGILFPNNLYEAHQQTSRQIKFKNDERINLLISARLPELQQKYSFEHNGLFIRPAVSSIELFDEGKTLSHCVGGYAERYAKGGTTILVIRKADEPDKPYHTMEIQDSRISQCRGIKNAQPTPDVAAFIEAFKAAKLTETKQRSKQKVKIAQPA